MKTLNLKNPMRNLALIGAGALMATLIVLPITTSADDDDDLIPSSQKGLTYAIRASDRSLSIFTLVEIDGTRVLTLVEEPVTRTDDDNGDDDDD